MGFVSNSVKDDYLQIYISANSGYAHYDLTGERKIWFYRKHGRRLEYMVKEGKVLVRPLRVELIEILTSIVSYC